MQAISSPIPTMSLVSVSIAVGREGGHHGAQIGWGNRAQPEELALGIPTGTFAAIRRMWGGDAPIPTRYNDRS